MPSLQPYEMHAAGSILPCHQHTSGNIIGQVVASMTQPDSRHACLRVSNQAPAHVHGAKPQHTQTVHFTPAQHEPTRYVLLEHVHKYLS